MSSLTRRDFIKITSGGAAALGLGSGLATRWWGLDDDPIVDPQTDGDRVVATFCELCFWKCGALAHIKDGVVTKITGNPDHPLSNGRLCPRGTAGTGLLYDPDRLRTPLIRRGERGSQRFDPVSWDDALDHVAEKLLQVKERHGSEALALFTHGFGGNWLKTLVRGFGSANIAAPSYAQCRGPREVGYSLTFGSGLGSPEAIDIENSRCITFIGSHLGENMHNTQVQELATALDRGAELVVVDPRFSTVAGKARYWLPIKPGTDIALLLAWMHVILTEERYDRPYIEKHATGLAQLKAHVADKTPDWAYAQTGIKPELIRETARFIASFKPASLIHPGRRTTWYGNDTQRARAMAILAALLGSWGRRGGYLITDRMALPDLPHPPYPAAAARADKPRDDAYPLASEALASGLCEATMAEGRAPRIKAWMVYGTNLMQALPDPRQTKKAIQELDFLVTVDVLPSEIAGYSDVVLPESTYLERMDAPWSASYKQPFIALRQPAVAPMYESRPGWWIARELGKRLDLEQYFPWRDSADYNRRRLAAAGHDLDKMAQTGVILGERIPTCAEEGLELTFDTDSGKIQLYSKPLELTGQPPLPEHTPPQEPPPGMFRLLFGRSPVHTFGRTTNNRFVGQIVPENELWVNAEVARELTRADGSPLRSGDRVVLVNQDGVRSTSLPVKITQRIRGDCVYLVHGFGHTANGLKFARGRGASDSDLVTRFAVDPVMGGTGMNVNFVRVEPAQEVRV